MGFFLVKTTFLSLKILIFARKNKTLISNHYRHTMYENELTTDIFLLRLLILNF